MTSARQQRADQRRQDILAAALEVFATKGYHAAGIADIAQLLGIGHGTCYRYFASKRAIFDALIAETTAQLADVMRGEPPTTDSLEAYREQLFRIAGGMFNLFAADPRRGRILLFETPAVDPELQQRFHAAMGSLAGLTRAYLDNGQAKGFLRENDSEIAARAINAVILEGIREICFSETPNAMARRWIEQGVPLMLLGLAR